MTEHHTKESGRLEHLCDEWPGDYSYPTDIIADVRELLAERDALREALEKIAAHDVIRNAFHTEIAMREIARDALERHP